MNHVSNTTIITPTPALDAADFLDQCAEMGKALFTKLRSLVENPPEDASERSSSLRELDSASRILKRIQESYRAASYSGAYEKPASRTGCQPVSPKSPAKTKNSSHGENPPANPLAKIYPASQNLDLIWPCSDNPANPADSLKTPIPKNKGIELPEIPSEIMCNSLQPETCGSAPNHPQLFATANLQPETPSVQPVASNPQPETRNPNPIFRPPLSRNQKKAARRRSKHKG